MFNGTGIDVNMAQKTLSDDLGIPSLLYAARVAFMPKGPIPAHQGRIDDLHNDKIMFALSASYNVEANWQTTNDLRLGFEFTYLKNRLYLGAEAYYLSSDLVKRQRVNHTYRYIGGYAQAAARAALGLHGPELDRHGRLPEHAGRRTELLHHGL